MIHIRPEISSLPANSRDDPAPAEAKRLGIANPFKLNNNESPWPPFPDAVEAIQAHLEDLNWYPDPTYARLREALGEHHRIDPDRVVVGNGSHSLIRLLGLVLLTPDDAALVPSPAYPAHPVATRLMGAQVIYVPLSNGACDLQAMLAAVTPMTRLAFICSPHNPTGSVVCDEDVEAYLDQVPEHVVTVFDQAYQEFVSDPRSADGTRYLDRAKPVIVLRTFSKIYGLAGMRVGYGLTSSELSGALYRANEPFPLNQLAVEAAIASLGRQDIVCERNRLNAVERQKVLDAARRLGLGHTPTQANFVFLDVRRDSRAVSDALLRAGIMVRSGDVHGSPTWIRMTLGSPDQNDWFIQALEKTLHEIPEVRDPTR